MKLRGGSKSPNQSKESGRNKTKVKLKKRDRDGGLTVVLELLRVAVTLRGGEEPPCCKAHVRLRPLSHLDSKSSLRLITRDLPSHTHTETQLHRGVTQIVKDLGSEETFLNPPDGFRSRSCPS